MSYSHNRSNQLVRIVLTFSLLLNGYFFFVSWRRNVVVSVPDGDSLQLADGRRVRLLGLDAPERDQCLATEARALLEQAAKGKHIRLKNTVTDDYGRILANVIIEDLPTWASYLRWYMALKFGAPSSVHDKEFPMPDPDPLVNRLMVHDGLARFSSVHSPYTDTLKSAQTEAKNFQRGIWSTDCRNSMPTNADCSIKGNIRAGKKTFLIPGCKNYDQTIIDESFGDVWFCTEEKATSAGFMKASGCI